MYEKMVGLVSDPLGFALVLLFSPPVCFVLLSFGLAMLQTAWEWIDDQSIRWFEDNPEDHVSWIGLFVLARMGIKEVECGPRGYSKTYQLKGGKVVKYSDWVDLWWIILAKMLLLGFILLVLFALGANTLWIAIIVGAAFSLKLSRRATKAVTKYKKELDSHIADKEAHK